MRFVEKCNSFPVHTPKFYVVSLRQNVEILISFQSNYIFHPFNTTPYHKTYAFVSRFSWWREKQMLLIILLIAIHNDPGHRSYKVMAKDDGTKIEKINAFILFMDALLLLVYGSLRKTSLLIRKSIFTTFS